MSAPMLVTVHPAIDEIYGQPCVFAGGSANASRAYAIAAKVIRRSDSAPQIFGFVGQDDALPTLPHNPPGLHLVPVPGKTRVNHYWGDSSGQHQEYGQSSLQITPADVQQMMQFIADQATRRPWSPTRWVAVTGSLPDGMTADFHVAILRLLKRQKANVLFDSRPENLRLVLDSDSQPDIIKPNQAELEQLLGESIDPLDDRRTLEQTKHLIPRGILVLSLGHNGILVRRGKKAWHITASLPPGYHCLTTNGCGDSVAGAMLAGLSSWPHSIPQAVKLGAAAGTANTTTYVPGEFEPELLKRILRRHTTSTRVA